MAALESQLIISADDRTAAAFASVQGKLKQLQSTVAAMDKVSMPALANDGALTGPGARGRCRSTRRRWKLPVRRSPTRRGRSRWRRRRSCPKQPCFLASYGWRRRSIRRAESCR